MLRVLLVELRPADLTLAIFIFWHPVVSMHAWLRFGPMSWIVPQVALHFSLRRSFVFICVFIGSASRGVSLAESAIDCPDEWSCLHGLWHVVLNMLNAEQTRLPEIVLFTLYLLFQLCVLEESNENANKLWYSVGKGGRGHSSKQHPQNWNVWVEPAGLFSSLFILFFISVYPVDNVTGQRKQFLCCF